MSGPVETVALYEVDLPEELVRIIFPHCIHEHIADGSRGGRKEGRL